jgi:hypothetical protein
MALFSRGSLPGTRTGGTKVRTHRDHSFDDRGEYLKSPELFVLVAIPLFVLVMLWGLTGLLGAGEHGPNDGTPIDLASLAERDDDDQE